MGLRYAASRRFALNACAVVSALAILIPACVKKPQLPDFGPLPEFSLVERSGRTIGRSDLLGRVWIVNFVFANCTGPCPRLSVLMKKFQQDLPEKIGLLTLTVDPTRDTPAVLTEYANRYGAKEGRWLFLTGEESRVRDLINQGFRLTMMESESGDTIIHSTRFALLGADGNVRGYYDGEDLAALKTLRVDAKALL